MPDFESHIMSVLQMLSIWTRNTTKFRILLFLSGEKVMLIILLCMAKQLCIPLPWRRSAIAHALPVHLGPQCLTNVFGDPTLKQVKEFRRQC